MCCYPGHGYFYNLIYIDLNCNTSLHRIDFFGLFPFYIVAWMIAGGIHSSTEQDALAYLRLFKLFRLFRLHRVITFFQAIKYSRKISLVSYTLIRNYSAAVFWCHLWACIMYFISRQYSFDEENTWIGSMHADMTAFDRYILSLYWSVVTVSSKNNTGIGGGDNYCLLIIL